MRYNTWDLTGMTHTELWDVHGFQYWTGMPDSGQTGTMITEFYGNTVVGTTGYQLLHFRGGHGLIFNNIFTGTGGFHADEYEGSCAADVPGASGVYPTVITNCYVWNNTRNGTLQNLVEGQTGFICDVAEDRNFWNYNSSFDGTAGIGRGTTTPGGTCSVGVGYWKASTATPTVSTVVNQAGHFYKCFSANTWTDYYTPYTFPHPLSDSGQEIPPPVQAGLVIVRQVNARTMTVP